MARSTVHYADNKTNSILKALHNKLRPAGTLGQEGLVHISELAKERVNRVEDVVKVGDKVKVQVKEIDNLGRVNLSRKALL